RTGMRTLIRTEIAQEKYLSGNIVMGRYDKLEETLLDIIAKYFHDHE
ncbi:hypothetical protein A2U01_0026716, partial [Trifolium medium]|nr:hypothetical protein [Trifolium medium]